MEDKNYIEDAIESNQVYNELEEKIYKLDIRAQELEILIDQIEEKSMIENDDQLYSEEYLEYKAEYKKIIKERKLLQKELAAQDHSKLNDISIWIVIYGVLMCLISFPLITGTLWLDFANIIIDLLSGAFSNLSSTDFIYNVIVFLIIFSFPLLINLITWMLYVNIVKKKADKKLYVIFWIIQGAMSLGMIIYMCIQLYGA